MNRYFINIPLSAWIGIVIIAVNLLAAVFAPWLAPHSETEQVGDIWLLPSAATPFGTDSLGRDMLSRILFGARTTIAIALTMPTKGRWSSLCLIVMTIPLLIPFNVVGTIWQIFGRADIGLMGYALNKVGISYNYAANASDAWVTVLVIDVWHWTSLVALLCYSGLRAIPDVYYQAARIDRASGWAVFRHIQLPKMKSVLLIAVMLRFMDSFMIYTEPFVLTGGGPGNSTTFLSQTLTTMALGQFDLGPAAAFSLVYFLIILLVSWVFYTAMTHGEKN